MSRIGWATRLNVAVNILKDNPRDVHANGREKAAARAAAYDRYSKHFEKLFGRSAPDFAARGE